MFFDNTTLPPIPDLHPMIVTSPSLRCGTTLLQRLLCSSRNAIIYGENCGYELLFFLNTYTAKVPFLLMNRPLLDTSLQKFLDSELDGSIVDLMPDVEGQRIAWQKSCFSWLSYCQEYAEKIERPIWGIKFPSLPPHTIDQIKTVLPQSRIVFIHRNLSDCLKSAKAWQVVNHDTEIRQFCTDWLEIMNSMMNRTEDRSLFLLDYNDLVSEPSLWIEKLSEFSGAQGIDPAVMNKKINTFGRQNSPNGAEYIPPIELSEIERTMVKETLEKLISSHN